MCMCMIVEVTGVKGCFAFIARFLLNKGLSLEHTYSDVERTTTARRKRKEKERKVKRRRERMETVHKTDDVMVCGDTDH